MKVRVESAHIESGVRKSERKCALALAVKAAAPHQDVWVGPDILTLVNHRYIHRYSLPSAAKRFVRSFDSGETVAPCQIDIGDSQAEDRSGGWWQRERA